MISNETNDIIHLHQALELAKIRRGFCSPNPSVGCVIINDQGELIAKGYHQQAGAPHAEIDALKNLPHAKNATAYITLEPCCHWGKTPPCTDALIQSGIKRVVYGHQDPNPQVKDKSAAILAAANIECDYLPTPEIQAFYTSYDYWQVTKLPYVTAKIAMTLNGMIAGSRGERTQITGEALQEFTHYSRRHSDALLTTAKTIIQDDPQLNVRSQGHIIAKPVYILDSDLRLPLTATILKTAHSVTVFHQSMEPSEKQTQLEALGVKCITVPTAKEGLNLKHILEVIGRDGIHDLWVEAGGRLFFSFMTQRLLQHAFFYIAPLWFDQGLPAFPEGFSLLDTTQPLHWEQVGNDVLCEVRW